MADDDKNNAGCGCLILILMILALVWVLCNMWNRLDALEKRVPPVTPATVREAAHG